jgi:acyl carrier protein
LIVDENGGPASVDVVGELYIGGVGVSPGYLGLHAETSDRFEENSSTAGERLYRTGDLALRRADGQLVVLGRTDFQVKIRGYRVEPAMVERAVQEHEAVKAVAVVADRNANGDRLVAFLVLDSIAPSLAALRTFLAERLPSYMLPFQFRVVERLPLLPNGKCDRNALASADRRVMLELLHPADSRTLPNEAHEQWLADTWSRVLETSAVCRRDDFFELGGDSLKAARVLAAIESAFGIAITFREFFDEPTIAQLGARIRARGRLFAPNRSPRAQG